MACSATNSLATNNSSNTTALAEVAPQSGQEVQERQELTTFDDDLAVLPEGVPGEIPVPSFDHDQFTDASIHSIISFLERPQLQSSFQWEYQQSGGASGKNTIGFDLLNTNSMPGLLVPSQVFKQMYLRKLDGFAGFKATAVFKLQVNSQPFMAGRLLMAATPMPTLLGPREQFLTSTISNLQCIHHVQMDIAKQTEVELRVPFISPYNCYDLISGNFDWAKLYVKVYSPLNTTLGAGTILECLLWVHFENIELGFPTSASLNNAIVPNSQSGQVNPIVFQNNARSRFDTSNVQSSMPINLWVASYSGAKGIQEVKSSDNICIESPDHYSFVNLVLRLFSVGNNPIGHVTYARLATLDGFRSDFYYTLAINGAGHDTGFTLPLQYWVKSTCHEIIIQVPQSNMRVMFEVTGSVTTYSSLDGNPYIKIDPAQFPLKVETQGSSKVVIDKCSLPVWTTALSGFDPFKDRRECGDRVTHMELRTPLIDLNPVQEEVVQTTNVDQLPLPTAPLTSTQHTTEGVLERVTNAAVKTVGNILPLSQSGKVSKIPVKSGSRVPPKEASNSQVAKARVQEQKKADSPFAASAKSWGSKIIESGTNIVNGVVGSIRYSKFLWVVETSN